MQATIHNVIIFVMAPTNQVNVIHAIPFLARHSTIIIATRQSTIVLSTKINTVLNVMIPSLLKQTSTLVLH